MGKPAAASSVLFESNADEVGWIEATIKANFGGINQLEVLEAGCGRAWYLGLEGMTLRITGVDLSTEALGHRMNAVGDLHSAIHGDLRDADLPAESFDLAYCAYVLEHVSGVEKVYRNLAAWTRPGGLIVLRLPDRDSIFGLTARCTPYRLHVWFYRWVLREQLAGVDGRPPFPTVYEEAIARPAIREYFEQRGFQVLGECLTIPFLGRHSSFWQAVRLALRTAGKLTLGRLSGQHTNITMILRKPAHLASKAGETP